MNYLAAAKALDALMLELIARGIPIPPHTVDDLKAGRALASMAARDPSGTDIEAKIVPVLESVEMNLLSLAETADGADYADSWQQRIAEAYQAPMQAPPIAGKLHGVPRDAYPIRIQTSELGGMAPAEELGLTVAAQEDGYTLIYGKKESVTAFLKDIRQKLGKVGFQRNS